MSRREPLDDELQGFQPIDPWKSEELALKRRDLPHLEVPGATYCVTVRCRCGIQLPPKACDLVMAAIRACDRKSIDLDAVVVMPDHVHAIFRLIGSCTPSQLLQSIKGRSARPINQLLKRRGAVWVDESFDHIIRDEAELEEKIEYLRQNSAKACLATSQAKVCATNYRWLYVRSFTG